MTATYGRRGIRYVDMEAGHAAQNLCLQAVALDLKSVVIGAFQDEAIQRIALLPEDEAPLYLVPVGR
jgi:nitroreductase